MLDIVIPFVFLWLGNRAGHSIAPWIGQNFFKRLFPNAQTRYMMVVSYLLVCWLLAKIILFTCDFFINSYYLHPDLISRWDSIRFGFGSGLLLALLNLYWSPSGIGEILKSVVEQRGQILILRKFAEAAPKKLIEQVLPAILNYYGKFTVIETQGEYIKEPLIESTPNSITFFGHSLYEYKHYSAVLLNRISRLYFDNRTWKAEFVKELERTRFVIIDLSRYSPNVLWEITQVQKKGAASILFIALDDEYSRRNVSIYESEFKKARSQSLSLREAPLKRWSRAGREYKILSDLFGHPLYPLIYYYPGNDSKKHKSRLRKFARGLTRQLANSERLTKRQYFGIGLLWLSLSLWLYDSLRSSGLPLTSVIVVLFLSLILLPGIQLLRQFWNPAIAYYVEYS